MATEIMTFGSSSSRKSPLMKWVDRLKGSGTITRTAVKNSVSVLRQGGESLAVGAILGAIASQRAGGLDLSFNIGTKAVTAPIDGVVAVLGLGLSAVPSLDEYSTDLRNAGSASLAIVSFRMTQQIIAKKKLAAHGEDFDAISDGNWGSEDPLIAAARAL